MAIELEFQEGTHYLRIQYPTLSNKIAKKPGASHAITTFLD